MSNKLNFNSIKKRILREPTEMSIEEYLDLCKEDQLAYASAAERMLDAIGQPEIIDTSKDPRLGRIFLNRKVKIYPAFKDFYGLEEPIEKIVSFFKHAAQGLEEKNQILYLLGPVGSGKSNLAETLKKLMEKHPIYVLKYTDENGNGEISPLFESPLGLFDPDEDGDLLEQEYGIDRLYLKTILSPWAAKKLRESQGDLSRFSVVKMWPSQLHQIGVTKVEPGDENNQDISTLVGTVDISKLEDFNQDDPDAYSYTGGLNVATQGMLEFVEMFKAPLKMLHPLLTATQEHHYNGTQRFGAMPFQGIILAHSNLSEWESFRNDNKNEAFIDRVHIVKVPYCLRVTEEQMIYKKLLKNSKLNKAPCAPGTLEMLSQFTVLSRLKVPENSSIVSKMRVYDGEDLKSEDPKAKSIQEYRDAAGVDEGMTGLSTRFAFKVLSNTFNFDTEEVAANPVHLLYVLEKTVVGESFPAETEQTYISYIKGILQPKYAQFIGEEIQKAYLESYHEYGQNLFERYITYADAWLQDQDYRDPETGQMYDREALNHELEKIEKSAGIVNAKEFRNEVVNFVLRVRAANEGQMPDWRSYNKLRKVIENRIFSATEELLPIISFGKKKSEEEEQKHQDFVKRMVERGYTEKQVRLLVEWFMRYRKNG